MNQAHQILRRIRCRYLLFGSFALRVYGFQFQSTDIDVWLDPSLTDEQWHNEVKHIAGEHAVKYRLNLAADPPFRFARIKTDPQIDLVAGPSKCQRSDFNPLHLASVKSVFGHVPQLPNILRSKLGAGREKDFLHVMQCAQQILHVE